MKKMNRADILKGLWELAHYINNEEIFYSTLSCGVADGDNIRDPEIMEDYIDDDDCAIETIEVYIRAISEAYHDGGFYDAQTRKVFGNSESEDE